MKKRLIVVLAMVMLTGCAGFGKWSAGAQKVVDMICAPTAEQQATAARMIAALDAAQAAGAIFFPAIGVEKASAVLNVIKGGGCFLVTELAEAFKAVDAANAVVVAKQMKATPSMAPAALPEYAPLRRLVK
jgi:hypothetical protein